MKSLLNFYFREKLINKDLYKNLLQFHSKSHLFLFVVCSIKFYKKKNFQKSLKSFRLFSLKFFQFWKKIVWRIRIPFLNKKFVFTKSSVQICGKKNRLQMFYLNFLSFPDIDSTYYNILKSVNKKKIYEKAHRDKMIKCCLT